uniref:Uncharacterized protein n=1 Tax=Trichobilharzia regenti TaxID=157069 RepID=A0AA85KI59_TRIRE|nr:unnamed protein product [Trichobilharzia regenti]
MILERLVSIAETWGGAENGFGLAECCDPKHFPETAGNVYFEYRPDHGGRSSTNQNLANPGDQSTSSNTLGTIVLQALHRRNQSPSEIMEELLAQHPVPVSRQMALFSRVRLATYFSDPTQRHKCIRARLQALSILCKPMYISHKLHIACITSSSKFIFNVNVDDSNTGY